MVGRYWEDAFGYTIFCDDVREEVGGKLTYVGVYAGHLFVTTEFPLTLAKLCLVIHYMEAVEAPKVGELRIRITFVPDGAEQREISESRIDMLRVREDAGSGLAPDSEVLRLVLINSMTPATFETPGMIRVRAYRGDDELRLGALRISTAAPEVVESLKAPERGPVPLVSDEKPQ